MAETLIEDGYLLVAFIKSLLMSKFSITNDSKQMMNYSRRVKSTVTFASVALSSRKLFVFSFLPPLPAICVPQKGVSY